jgi:DNA-directed RNA polymerase subunit L
MEIKEIENTIDDYNSTFLKLDIQGKQLAYPIISSIRKACMNQIPIYAFHPSKIKILRNNSVFDNSYMKGRLSNLPIPKINHGIKFLQSKYYKNINFDDPKAERHPDDETQIEYYVKAKNNGPEKILNVTTNDLRISVNSEIIENKEKYSTKNPILLIQLRQNEEVELSMKGVLAVGELDAIFDSANAYYEEITPTHYYFMIESNGQLDEYDIMLRACDIIIEKNKLIKENINNNQYNMMVTDNNSMILEIENEDYTCGGPINYILQNMDKVLFSGISKPDFMQKNIMIKFKVDKKYNLIDVLNEAIDQSITLFEEFREKINSIYKGDNNSSKSSKSETKKTNKKK